MLPKGLHSNAAFLRSLCWTSLIGRRGATLWCRVHTDAVLCASLQCDMQKLTVEELKRLLYDTFCDHLSMKDIENIIMTEENHIENPEDCQVDIDSKEEPFYTFCPVFTRR